MLRIGEFESPHPRYPFNLRSKLFEYFKEDQENNDVIIVEVRGKHELTEDQQSIFFIVRMGGSSLWQRTQYHEICLQMETRKKIRSKEKRT